MNAGTALRFALIFLSGLFLFMWLGRGDSEAEKQPITEQSQVIPEPRQPYRFCELKTATFRAELSTRGAVLKHFELLTPKYKKQGKGHDLSTTPQPGANMGTAEEFDPNWKGDHEFRQQLFAQFRNATSPGVPGGETPPNWNLRYDSVDWTLDSATESRCEFSYRDAEVALKKTVQVTDRAYELEISHSIENLAAEPRWHAMAVDTTAWWLNSAVEGHMFRVSPYITDVECVLAGQDAVRLHPQDFEPSDFEAPEFAQTGAYGWYQPAATPQFAAVSNAYFSHALVPLEQDAKPSCQLQIEYRQAKDAAYSGAFYRARLAYPARNLEPGASANYKLLSYIGPKERSVLIAAGGGKHQLIDLIDLGFFAAIAKVLVSFLLKVHSFLPNWGIAIIILTVCARVLLFPLALPGIRTMIKMRELKPEMDKLTEKYGDDMRGKGVAQMELWRKHGLTPFDQLKGCLPQLATMPVWFALYTTLQTAVELYNIRFLWFPDLSEPDPIFVLPVIIGATYFLQQKITPFQGDPAQRKMMLYFMPGMFTVFMLFLPAGLGVYMFTNSLLAIGQQYAVELHAKSKLNKGAVEVLVREDEEGGPASDGKKGKRNRRRQEAS
jgi:YidC/Oxa1 family membrane protein insertase